MSARLFDPEKGLYDHAWFANTDPDPRFYWGRGAGWALMAMAELLSVMPEDHPDRPAVLAQYRRAVQGVAAVQGSQGFWHQLLDKVDSYLETSTSVFTLPSRAAWPRVARADLTPCAGGWRAIESRGAPARSKASAWRRRRTTVYYYNRPTELGAMQGYGPAQPCW
jgi:hypothetical protein